MSIKRGHPSSLIVPSVHRLIANGTLNVFNEDSVVRHAGRVAGEEHAGLVRRRLNIAGDERLIAEIPK
jgi:hypothetical protein